MIFKPDMHQLKASVPSFLKIISFVHKVGISVCAPQGYKLHSHDIEPVYQGE